MIEKSMKLPPYWIYVGLVLLTVAVYYPILSNQLLDFWDDQWVVTNYYTEGGFTVHNLIRILTEFYHGQYAPLNELLYLSLYSLFGYNPVPFHLASLVLHAVNTCLVFLVIRKILRLTGRVGKENKSMVSLITAIFFCIHPLAVESVAWMSASKVLVYAFFYLLGLYTFLRYLETRQMRFYLFTLLFYVCSYLGKEQAVTFPVCMLLLYWFLDSNTLKCKKTWFSVVPFFTLSVCFGLITLLSQQANGEGAFTSEATYPLWQRVVYGCYALFEYLYKIILPFRLSYIYPFPTTVGSSLPFWLLFYPVMLFLICVCLWKYISHKAVLFGLLFFLIHIAVALHIIPLSRFTVVADRYAYLSLIGIGFILGWLFSMNYKKLSGGWRSFTILILAGYFLYLGIYSNRRCLVWYNVDTLKKEIRNLLEIRNETDTKTYKYE